jgi:hypothetical protein
MLPNFNVKTKCSVNSLLFIAETKIVIKRMFRFTKIEIIENGMVPNSSYIIACVFIATRMCLQSSVKGGTHTDIQTAG